VAGLAVVGGTWVGVLLFAAVSFWSLHEYLRMSPADARNKTVELFAYAAVPVHYVMIVTSVPPFAAGLAVWTFVVLPFVWIFSAGSRGALVALPRVQWGLVLVVAAISYVARLLALNSDVGPAGGAGLAALLLLSIMSNDAAQYVFGKLWGHRKLAPALSPQKTWEGLAGGIAATMLVAAAAAPLVTPLNRIQGAAVGAALSVAGLLGDLMVSSLKRDAGVKDTGAVLPQHGGVLDRCDSLLLAAPLYFYGMQLWLF
jgi:phosphatidate cytidylyltransferase